MGMKGALRVVECANENRGSDRIYTLVATAADDKALTPAERYAYRSLFARSERLELRYDRENGRRVDGARAELHKGLRDEYHSATFRRNGRYTIGGAFAGISAALLFFGLFENWQFSAFRLWLMPTVFAACLTYLAGFVSVEIRDLRSGNNIYWSRLLRRLSPTAAFAIMGLWLLFDPVSDIVTGGVAWRYPVIPAAGAAFGIAIGVFHFLMAAPTNTGRRLMNQIDGFALYLRTADDYRLNLTSPPKLTSGLYLRLLPYAVALSVVDEWRAKFAYVLSADAVPDWYDGDACFDVGDFAGKFGHAVASATAPPISG